MDIPKRIGKIKWIDYSFREGLEIKKVVEYLSEAVDQTVLGSIHNPPILKN